MPVERSWEIVPTICPGTVSLNEFIVFGMTVTTEDSDIGMADEPRLRNGWPKAYMRSPSRCVTVPEAATEKSPRTSSTLIDEPGVSVWSVTLPSGERMGANCWRRRAVNGEPVATGATKEMAFDCAPGSFGFQSTPESWE